MADGTEYRLKINGFTPTTITMERLAEYMAAFSKLLGYPDGVHFVKMENASAGLLTRVRDTDEPKVAKRLQLVKMGGGPIDARNAQQKIDDMLFDDGTDGIVLRQHSNLIVFPGKARPMPIVFNPVIQEDVIEGVLISLGGKDETVPVHLADGDRVYKCNTTRAIARQMGPHIFGPVLRAYGEASWRREANGEWKLNTMNIVNFAQLNSDPAEDVIRRLRAIPGNEWDKVEDPYALLTELRGEEDEK
ncbi:MAG: hypothetical protein P4L10_12755 [Acidobacteriaceae bacterium]|nr:hypothetical protein [Acidobacteriaceae bacterium]